MKKYILLLLLATFGMQAQTLQNPTYGNVKLKNNQTSTTATKVNVQENDGTINTKPLSELANYVEFASAVNLPVTGEQGKLYLTKDNNKIYRWNGTYYTELAGSDISGKEDIANKQNSLSVDGTGTKYPTVDAVFDALATKAPISSVHNPVTLGTANGLSLSTQQLSLGLASSGVTGALKGTDWNTFNNKVNGTGTNNFLTKWSGTNTVAASGAWREIGGRLNNSATDDIVSTFQNTGNLRNIGAIKRTSGSVTDYSYISQGEIGFIGRGATGELPVLMSRNTSATQEAMVINAIQDEDVARTAMSDMVFRTAWLNSNSITAYTSDGVAFSFQNGTNILSRIYRNGNIVFGSSSDNTVDKLQVKGTISSGTTALGNTPPTANNQLTRKDYVDTGLAGKEPSFTKNTAFNKNFGTTAGTVVEGGTLGSNAYTSTAYLPLTGNSTVTGTVTVTGDMVSNTVFRTLNSTIGGLQISKPGGGVFWQIGVGLTELSENLTFSNSIGASNLSINQATGAATFSSTVTASGGFFNSDRRLKNIFKRDGDVAYYTWKDGRDNKQHIGYVAQEVQENHPNQVQADEKGMLSVNYVEILVEKIRVLEKRIEQLEKSK